LALSSALFLLCWVKASASIALMDTKHLLDGLIAYLCFLPILTFHEFAHAWVAWKCGDDTARLQGRITLNPVAHIDLLGTIILPLAAVFLSAANSGLAGFIIGWGKPVPVNIYNLRHRRRDDTLVALAGPAMNLLLAAVIVILAQVGALVHSETWVRVCLRLALLSLFLGYFNLLPVPPLDGSHVLKNLVLMSDEMYWRLCQYGFLIVIVVIQIPLVNQILHRATIGTLEVMFRLVAHLA
jgi:Zn-dependent protease